MANRLLSDPDNDGWERSDFPIVCETCLGPNPYVRMQRIEFGGTCHISGRPYTVFRWRPGSDARYKKTIICQEVAKAKNVCQVCLFDLDYGLPVQVRDTALGIEKEDIPESDVGKEFQLNEQIQRGQTESAFGGGGAGGAGGGAGPGGNDMLMRLARTTPYYKRNQARICTFFVKGQCNRGAECPYRHEMPVENELSNQNIKDRYYGINDPVANKMLRRVGEQQGGAKLEPPEDKTITSLYVGGVTTEISEEDLRDTFYAYGELTSVRIVASRFCAFVTFAERGAAERAADALAGKLMVKGVRLRLMWGRGGGGHSSGQPRQHDPMQPIPTGGQQQGGGGAAGGVAGGAAAAAQHNFFGLPPGGGAGGGGYYPSMDSRAHGAPIAPKRPAEGEPQQDDKRQRSGTGFGGGGMPPMMPPSGYRAGPPPGYGAPQHFHPPPQHHPGMFGPGGGGPRPPAGGPPPSAAAAAPPAAAVAGS